MLSNRRAPTTIYRVGQSFTARVIGGPSVDVTATDPQGNPYLRDRSNGRTELVSVLYLQTCYFKSPPQGRADARRKANR